MFWFFIVSLAMAQSIWRRSSIEMAWMQQLRVIAAEKPVLSITNPAGSFGVWDLKALGLTPRSVSSTKAWACPIHFARLGFQLQGTISLPYEACGIASQQPRLWFVSSRTFLGQLGKGLNPLGTHHCPLYPNLHQLSKEFSIGCLRCCLSPEAYLAFFHFSTGLVIHLNMCNNSLILST